MKIKHVLILIVVSSLYACTGQSIKTNAKDTIRDTQKVILKPVPEQSLPSHIYDTLLYLFSDTSYQVRIQGTQVEEGFDEAKNIQLTFYRAKDANRQVFFQDSLHAAYFEILMGDMNNDHVKDLMVFDVSGVRANLYYHLYLLDTVKKYLIRVKGFEDVVNPSFDSVDNIIESIGLAGETYYSFYRINKQNKLLSFGRPVVIDLSDTSTQYDRIVKNILKKYGK